MGTGQRQGLFQFAVGGGITALHLSLVDPVQHCSLVGSGMIVDGGGEGRKQGWGGERSNPPAEGRSQLSP